MKARIYWDRECLRWCYYYPSNPSSKAVWQSTWEPTFEGLMKSLYRAYRDGILLQFGGKVSA